VLNSEMNSNYIRVQNELYFITAFKFVIRIISGNKLALKCSRQKCHIFAYVN